MIDMNQSIEAIMQECDYIAEVKGDSEIGYSVGRNMSYGTNKHEYGLRWNGNDAGYLEKGYRSGRARAVERKQTGGMKTAEDYRSTVSALKKNKDKADISNNKHEEWRRKKQEFHGVSGNSNDRKRARRAANESSIFDDLLDLV
jgi:hypothetical protein